MDLFCYLTRRVFVKLIGNTYFSIHFKMTTKLYQKLLVHGYNCKFVNLQNFTSIFKEN